MNTKMLLILALGGLVVYMIIKTSQPKPSGPQNVLTDLGKLVGDFSGNAA